jgi:hypothetical protein
MSAKEFIKWLDETLLFLGSAKELNEVQTQILKEKLNKVFNKVTPPQPITGLLGMDYFDALDVFNRYPRSC